jgi:transcriptional regulator with XRE-family HTH domain
MHQPNPESELANGVTKPVFSSTKTEGQFPNKIEDSRSIESGEENVRRLLSEYEIGRKLRQLRLKKKIALTDLGRQTDLSASMLSQLENGKLVPTLPTLARIALVFEIGLEHFFSDKRERRLFSVVRAEERPRFPQQTNSPKEVDDNMPVLRGFFNTPAPGYFFEVLASGVPHKNMSAFLAEFPLAGEQVARLEHSHEGSEFIHVLEGVLAIHYQAEQHLLRTGDSVHFDASEAHSYSGHSETPAKAIIVTVPPRL